MSALSAFSTNLLSFDVSRICMHVCVVVIVVVVVQRMENIRINDHRTFDNNSNM